LTPGDHFESFLAQFDATPARLELAKRNLERLDALGVQERFEDFCSELSARYGWRQAPVDDRHVASERCEAPRALRRRIAEDNRADCELYEHALSLLA
jgi:hypothetical protein